MAERAAGAAEKFAAQAAKAADDAHRAAVEAAAHAEAAADAAELAAKHAGEAEHAAARSKAHAEAALKAATAATDAAAKALEVAQLAEAAEEARLATFTAEGVAAARLAHEEEAAQDAKAAWDAVEKDRIDTETKGWLAAASAPGAPASVVLDKGRRAAAALRKSAGPWTRAAAEQALAGGEVELRAFLSTGLKVAEEQDDRARVAHISDTGKPELKAAAEAALAGRYTDVLEFLRTREYEGKEHDERVEIGRLLKFHPGPEMDEAANAALTGTAAARLAFLTTGQYDAVAHDDRIAVGKIMTAGKAEVKAAAQIALVGPRSYLRHFILVGQFKAQRRDLEAATHFAQVDAHVADGAQYAANARRDAAEAGRVAALARNAADDAKRYSDDAKKAATDADGHAEAAKKSAARAKASAEQAARSAQAAREAAVSARRDANAAKASAAQAHRSAVQARVHANKANAAAEAARASAIAAGKDAYEATKVAAEAFKIVADKLKAEEDARRKAGKDPAGQNCWLYGYDMRCNNGDNPMAREWSKKWFTTKCDLEWGAESQACVQIKLKLNDILGDFAKEAELWTGVVLAACGIVVPVAGIGCDLADAVRLFASGEDEEAYFALLSMIPILEVLAVPKRGANILRDMQKLEKLEKLKRLKKLCGGNFAPNGLCPTGIKFKTGLSDDDSFEVWDAIQRAQQGKTRFYGRDGKPFENHRNGLPSMPDGHYAEWTAAPATVGKKADHRIIIGGNPKNPDSIWYWDHKSRFVRLK